jgi:hypothetical protein
LTSELGNTANAQQAFDNREPVVPLEWQYLETIFGEWDLDDLLKGADGGRPLPPRVPPFPVPALPYARPPHKTLGVAHSNRGTSVVLGAKLETLAPRAAWLLFAAAVPYPIWKFVIIRLLEYQMRLDILKYLYGAEKKDTGSVDYEHWRSFGGPEKRGFPNNRSYYETPLIIGLHRVLNLSLSRYAMLQFNKEFKSLKSAHKGEALQDLKEWASERAIEELSKFPWFSEAYGITKETDLNGRIVQQRVRALAADLSRFAIEWKRLPWSRRWGNKYGRENSTRKENADRVKSRLLENGIDKF